MNCKYCGSQAINHNLHGRDGSRQDVCDVCYWRYPEKPDTKDCPYCFGTGNHQGSKLGMRPCSKCKGKTK